MATRRYTPATTPTRKRSRRAGAYDLPMTVGTPERTPGSRHRKMACAQTPDRYIPSRSTMDIMMISNSLRSAEKYRAELTPKLFERSHQLSLGQAPAENAVATSPKMSDQAETAEQTAFWRTMSAILHDKSVGEFGDDSVSAKVPEPTPAEQTGKSIMSLVHPACKTQVQKAQDQDGFSHLAYSSVPEMENQVNPNSRYPDMGRKLYPERLLTYHQPSRPFTNRRINPFEHSHHHVIQQASSTKPKDGFPFEKPATKSAQRKIPEKPTKVLDAPDIVDDYYLNLISWSKDNILAVAMGPSVYIWNATNGDIGHVVTLGDVGDYVSSVSWSTIPGCTKYLAIGTHSNIVQLWDTESQRCVRKLQGHSNRISAMSWNTGKRWLTSGGRDSQILQHDVRTQNHIVARYKGHRQEVCGLKWNEDGHALASGGNENFLCIWDAAMSRRSNRRQAMQELDVVSPRLLLTQHKAAVKALDWCPFNRGLLASGGGSADRTIKFWNTLSGTLTNSVDTGSQVCSLLWSKHQRELCSSHGFSENQLILWKYPSMTKIQEFKSHTARVLNMEMSPDGQSVVSVGADETLRFWDIFGPPKKSKRRDSAFLRELQCPGIPTIR